MILTDKAKAHEWVRGLKVREVVTFEKSGNFYALRVVDVSTNCEAFSGRACKYNDIRGCYRVVRGAGRSYWTVGDLVGAEV